MNLQLNFSYFDYENRRVTSRVSFSNPGNVSGEEVERILRQHLIMDQYFIPAEWIPVPGELADDDILAEFESLDTTNSNHCIATVDVLLERVCGRLRSLNVPRDEAGALKAA